MQCELWLTEFKSVTRVQRRVRIEWNVDHPTSESIHQWERTLGDRNFGISNWLGSLFQGKPLELKPIYPTNPYITEKTSGSCLEYSSPPSHSASSLLTH
ncbi:hypothetical protein TNCV_3938451 [Trichonephila clavipes]|nr:hypothetical protein TNCV_3938451 [Trichonephila clavipes]